MPQLHCVLHLGGEKVRKCPPLSLYALRQRLITIRLHSDSPAALAGVVLCALTLPKREKPGPQYFLVLRKYSFLAAWCIPHYANGEQALAYPGQMHNVYK